MRKTNEEILEEIRNSPEHQEWLAKINADPKEATRKAVEVLKNIKRIPSLK